MEAENRVAPGPPDADEPLATEAILEAEPTLLDAMLAMSKENESRTEIIEIKRKGEVVLAFRIRALTEKETDECDRKATVYRKDRRAIAPIPVETIRSVFRSLLVVKSTVSFCERNHDGTYRDVSTQWNDAALLDKFGTADPAEVVDKVLLPGEKDAVIERINILSGFDGPNLEEQAKN